MHADLVIEEFVNPAGIGLNALGQHSSNIQARGVTTTMLYSN